MSFPDTVLSLNLLRKVEYLGAQMNIIRTVTNIPRMASSRFFHQIFEGLSGNGFYSDRKMVAISEISEFQSICG